MQIRALAARHGTERMHGVATEGIDTENQQQKAPEKLEVEDVLVDIVEHEAHAVTREQGVEDVAQRGTDTRDEAIPAALVERTLDAQHTHRPQRRRHNDADNEALPQDIEYGLQLNHAAKIVQTERSTKQKP